MTAPPVQVAARLVANDAAGAYRVMTLRAEQIAASARPGQFVAVSIGGPASALLLRRSFAVCTADPDSGLVQIVVAEHGDGTAWLVRAPVGSELAVGGPLGRPFRLPSAPGPAVLVGGGYGSAAMLGLADLLHAAGCAVHLVLGAAGRSRLFGVEQAVGVAVDSVRVCTEDGSAGHRGIVTDGLAELVDRVGARQVYACGPMGMLRAVGVVAGSAGVPCQVAVEESMACGIGVCMTCVLPVVGTDGRSRMVRSCIDGPVFDAERVRWDDVGTLPGDLVGAEAMTAH